MARAMYDRRSVQRVVGALLIGAVVLTGQGIAGQSLAGAQDDPPAPPAMTPPAMVERTIVLASGIDGVGLTGATDDLDGSPLEVRTAQPTFPGEYELIPGAELITDRWATDGTQGRSWATDLGAKVVNKPVATFNGDRYFDFGPDWYSKRTFRASVEIPAGSTVGVSLMDVMADNNVAVNLVNAAGTTPVSAATCAGYTACDGDSGRDNFRKVRTITVDPTVFRPGINTFEFTVEDWGTVVGLSFKIAITLTAIGTQTPCGTTAAGVSCSLTAATLSNLPAGMARYCYVADDGVPRTFRVPTADGATLVYTLSSGTWVDAPVPAGDVVFYPTEDTPLPFSAITDALLSRCPGAATSPSA